MGANARGQVGMPTIHGYMRGGVSTYTHACAIVHSQGQVGMPTIGLEVEPCADRDGEGRVGHGGEGYGHVD